MKNKRFEMMPFIGEDGVKCYSFIDHKTLNRECNGKISIIDVFKSGDKYCLFGVFDGTNELLCESYETREFAAIAIMDYFGVLGV